MATRLRQERSARERAGRRGPPAERSRAARLLSRAGYSARCRVPDRLGGRTFSGGGGPPRYGANTRRSGHRRRPAGRPPGVHAAIPVACIGSDVLDQSESSLLLLANGATSSSCRRTCKTFLPSPRRRFGYNFVAPLCRAGPPTHQEEILVGPRNNVRAQVLKITRKHLDR